MTSPRRSSISKPDTSTHRSSISRSQKSVPWLSSTPTFDSRNLAMKRDSKTRRFSVKDLVSKELLEELQGTRARVSSEDPGSSIPRQFMVDVNSTLKALLAQEDTDKNVQITVEDNGPKIFSLGTAGSEGYKKVELTGNYSLSNLLQELTLAQDMGLKEIVIDEANLTQNPVDRLEDRIRSFFWGNLTRRIDASNIVQVAKDPKDWTADPRPRVYIPQRAPEQYAYYQMVAKQNPGIRLDVQWLAEDLTPEYIRDLNSAPGLLALAMDEVINSAGELDLVGKPYIVPGGRFNELYGWDSYMALLGLLLHNKVSICKSMVENFIFCIQHYGRILNANRSYYLGRSQPPFLTDMALRVFERIRGQPGALDFLKISILAAIKEYYHVWVADPRFDEHTGLSRYRPMGIGVPPETEPSHFLPVLQPYADKHKVPVKEFVEAYNNGLVKEPELDEFFLHDRAVRESGHDTTYRLERVAADVATVDLNSCLYKIECDIAHVIRDHFNNNLLVPREFHVPGMKVDVVENSATWDRRAKKRRMAMEEYMWDQRAGMFFDYNTETEEVHSYESATTFWAMWAGVATPRQAAAMVIKALPRFEEYGGLSSGTEKSRGAISLHRPNRQWDYPFGWAPHQILAWSGLERYGYHEEAQRLVYKWLFMVTKAFVDFNGVVVEKYDVTQPHHPHKVEAEYGNQGADFKGVPREGFAWVNASYVVGLSVVDTHMRRALGALTDWDSFWEATRDLEVTDLELERLRPETRRVRTGLFHECLVEPVNTVEGPKGLGRLQRSRKGMSQSYELPCEAEESLESQRNIETVKIAGVPASELPNMHDGVLYIGD